MVYPLDSVLGKGSRVGSVLRFAVILAACFYMRRVLYVYLRCTVLVSPLLPSILSQCMFISGFKQRIVQDEYDMPSS